MINAQKIWVTLADFDGVTLKAFYRNLFGQDPEVDIPNVYAEFNLPGLRLGLFKPKSTHQTEFVATGAGGMSLCLEVENLEEAIAHFQHNSNSWVSEIQETSHGRETYAYDPYGNRIILYEPH